MNEQLLQFIWKYRLFNFKDISTIEGHAVEILKVGTQNLDSGADFSNARLKIDGLQWAGNVEIEIDSENWEKHGHKTDASHNNTLLLVCLNHNAKNPIGIPVIELKGRVKESLLKKYTALMEGESFIPCQNLIKKVDEFTMQSWRLRLLAERLEHKIKPILSSLKANKNNWEETFYHALAKNFGFNTNAVPFELLAKSISLTVLAKHKNKLQQLEALFLGQAGFLQAAEEKDKYTEGLEKEYSFLAKKYSLTPLDVSLWKFSKTRPANFPSIRIAQFAALVHTSTHLFSKILEAARPHPLKKLLSIKASQYWDTHYRLSVETDKGTNMLGEDAMNNILINTIAPFFFAYAITKNEEEYKYRAINLLEALPAEDNRITRGYEAIGMTPKTAADSQGILQLNKHWCKPKRCLDCRIGHAILSK
jgi:hypothetical protein